MMTSLYRGYSKKLYFSVAADDKDEGERWLGVSGGNIGMKKTVMGSRVSSQKITRGHKAKMGRLGHRVGVSALLWGGLALALSAAEALAQDATLDSNNSNVVKQSDVKNDSGTNKVNEAYDAKGIDLGPYLVFPQIETEALYESNVYASQNAVKSDWLASVTPSFRAQSRFENHALNFNGSASKVDYWTYKSDNRLDAQVGLDGRLDITHEAELDATLSTYSGHEDRGSPDSVGSQIRPTPVSGLKSSLGGKDVLGSLTLASDVEYDRYAFQNVATNSGSEVVNSSRNRDEVRVTERAQYELKPGYSAVLQTQENSRTYRNLDTTGLKRDSSGFRVESGLGLDISQLIKGDLLLGYFQQNYDSASLSQAQGLAAHFALNWTPTPRTLVVPAIERIVDETTQSGAASTIHTDVSVMVRHELLRNLVVTGYLAGADDQFVGLHQSFQTFEERLSLTYAFTRELYLRGEVNEKQLRSDIELSGFDQTKVGLVLGLRM